MTDIYFMDKSIGENSTDGGMTKGGVTQFI